MSGSPGLPLLVMAFLAAPAPAPLDGVLNGPADQAAFLKARADLQGCVEPICRAVDHLAQAFQVASRRDLPDTMVHLDRPSGDPQRKADEALERLLPTAGPLHRVYCPVLTKMARHYSAYSVGLLVIELANRVDGAGEQCTRDVIAAFPSTKDAAAMIAYSREVCEAARRGGCRRDRRSAGE